MFTWKKIKIGLIMQCIAYVFTQRNDANLIIYIEHSPAIIIRKLDIAWITTIHKMNEKSAHNQINNNNFYFIRRENILPIIGFLPLVTSVALLVEICTASTLSLLLIIL